MTSWNYFASVIRRTGHNFEAGFQKNNAFYYLLFFYFARYKDTSCSKCLADGKKFSGLQEPLLWVTDPFRGETKHYSYIPRWFLTEFSNFLKKKKKKKIGFETIFNYLIIFLFLETWKPLFIRSSCYICLLKTFLKYSNNCEFRSSQLKAFFKNSFWSTIYIQTNICHNTCVIYNNDLRVKQKQLKKN